jgi:phosphocarrier protein HPr
MGPLRQTLTITNQRGLHARAAAKFVRVAGAYAADVEVTKGDQTVSGVSIMGLMMLAAGIGSTIDISATGEDAEAAMAALMDLVGRKFDED